MDRSEGPEEHTVNAVSAFTKIAVCNSVYKVSVVMLCTERE